MLTLFVAQSAGALPRRLTRAAASGAIRLNHRVRFGEFVTTMTVCLSCMLRRWANAAKYVLCEGHGLKMRGVLACPVPAKMVNDQPLGDGTVGQFPSYPVGSAPLAITVSGDPAVPAGVYCGQPGPACIGSAALVDLRPEPIDERHSLDCTRSVPLSVSHRDADDSIPPRVTLCRDRRLPAAPTVTHAIAVGPAITQGANLRGTATIGGKHRKSLSGEPLGVCRAARGNSVARNYSISVRQGGVL